MSTYDVRIWGLQEHRSRDRKSGREKASYRFRWQVGGKAFGRTFQTKALAESFRSRLLVATREGVAFDEKSGLPEPMARELNVKDWFTHACAFVDMKWPWASPRQRKSIAESLTTVTPALFATERGAPSAELIRRALYSYCFNAGRRAVGPPSDDLASTVRWLSANTLPMSEVGQAPNIRKALDLLALRLNGRPAAAATIARKRAVFYGALRYAVELELFESHPMDRVQWVTPKANDEVDRRSVINPRQAVDLLAAVNDKEPRLTAFFATMYYAALRPAEAIHLRLEECELPESGWGWLHLTGSTQHAGGGWTDDGKVREERGLKHRAKSSVRDVPAVPELVKILRAHVAEFGPVGEGRLFVTRTLPPRPISLGTYTRAFRQARERSFTTIQQRSPLAKVPYDLRHAAVSLWLNSGVPATQVAQWAGHSVNVLLKVYAKCIDGQDEAARKRIEAALKLGAEE